MLLTRAPLGCCVEASPGAVVALRADMEALPVTSKWMPFKSSTRS
jgi:hypothetical protein